MKVIDTEIPDVKIIEPVTFGDERGFFMKPGNKRNFVNWYANVTSCRITTQNLQGIF